MMKHKSKKLIIFGNNGFAEVAYEYFMQDSEYEVCGFTVDKEYLPPNKKQLFGLPIIAFEDVVSIYPPDKYEMFIAVTYTNLNRLRKKIINLAINSGYRIASFISSNANISPSAMLGKFIFILEGNVIQSFSEIGDGSILWSGNHVGHHSRIGNYVFISSHVVISGYSAIGDNCFLGVNSAIGDGVVIGEDSWLSSGVTVTQSTEANSLLVCAKSTKSKIGAKRFFKVRDDS